MSSKCRFFVSITSWSIFLLFHHFENEHQQVKNFKSEILCLHSKGFQMRYWTLSDSKYRSRYKTSVCSIKYVDAHKKIENFKNKNFFTSMVWLSNKRILKKDLLFVKFYSIQKNLNTK